ncbi:MAG: GAF domain-containing sensor histidine kinase [Candidatus Fermentibacteraceae bacterium]|nr:GAF domain-containing sensor histidine kinase [Candidatus Fermentibacteraceae bacterium]
MSVKKNIVEFTFQEDSLVMSFLKNALHNISQSMSQLLDKFSIDRDVILNILSLQEDGSLPILLDGQIWLSTSMSSEDTRITSLKSASRLELEEWLEIYHGGRPGILTDESGHVYAMTETASMIYAGFKGTSLRDFLDQVSMTAFISASSKCLSGKQVREFSVLTKTGHMNKRSFVASLQKVGVGSRLLIVSFSSPSMAMTTFEQDDSKFAKTLFSVIPIPAIRIDEKGTIVAVNSYAAHIVSSSGGMDPISTQFNDWIIKEDKARVSALLESRTETMLAPFQFRAGLTMTETLAIHFEMTSLLMPDGESLIVFFKPVDMIRGSETETFPGQIILELLDSLSEFSREKDSIRSLLEFLRIGTGARGAAYISRSRKVAVGDAPLTAIEQAQLNQSKNTWTEDVLGFNLTIPVLQKQGQAHLKITGTPSRNLDPLGRLVLQLVPILMQYSQSYQHHKNTLKLLNSISDFMTLLKGRKQDVRMILDEIGSIVGADYMVIHTVGSRESVLRPLISSGTSTDPGVLSLETPSIASWAYTHTETCYVPDTAVDQRFSPVFPSSRSELTVPLISEGRAIGTLTAGSSHRDAFKSPFPGLLRTLCVGLSLWLLRNTQEDKKSNVIQQEDKPTEYIGLEDLLLSLSHRMRAPITTLRGHTDLLISERLGDLTSDQRNSLKAMNTALIDLVEYAERMLTFMKIELSDEALNIIWARPADVVSSLLPIFSEMGKNQKVSVRAELPSEPFTASFDRSRLEQIIGNLVHNAIQYNEPDGSVNINVTLDKSSHWILEVFNTGSGIPPEDLPNVFDRFYTGSNNAEVTRGLGIGLTIVKSFTQQMGGTVSVRSRAGYGTWFTVRLPLS